MTEIIFNPSKIEIKRNSAVLLCGAQNSGKSTFATQHFEKSMILSSDDIFLEVTRKNFKNTFATDDMVFQTAENLILKRISERSGNTMILDQVSPQFDSRIESIKFLKDYFDNIILIVFAIDIKKILSRPSKNSIPENVRFNYFPPSKNEIILNALIVNEQIRSGKIIEGTNKTYVFTSNQLSDICKIQL